MEENLCAACECSLADDEDEFCSPCRDGRVTGQLIYMLQNREDQIEELKEQVELFKVIVQYERYLLNKSEVMPPKDILDKALALSASFVFHTQQEVTQ